MSFGGVAVFLFGDIMQIRPVRASYIFEEPKNYKNSFLIEPLFNLFQRRFLTYNHRQGNDLTYSEILNRMRVSDGRAGEHREDDIDILRSRVFLQNDPVIPKEALYLVATNAEVNEINQERLGDLPGELMEFETIIISKTGSSRKPTTINSGEVKNTMLQAKLRLKIGCKVMLTYNIDTTDGLTNGARGELIGCESDSTGGEMRVKRLYVHFNEKKIGREKRKSCHVTHYLRELKENYPDKLPTPVDRLEFRYSPNKNGNSGENTAINFPLRLCFATTAHRIQGQTVRKPEKLVVNFEKVRHSALAYVMLSRVESLDQVYIVNDVHPEKIFADENARSVLQEMTNEFKEESLNQFIGNIFSLNVRSLPRHFSDLELEDISYYDLILLQQTCLSDDLPPPDRFRLEQFSCHLNSSGPGGGLAVYFKSSYSHVEDIKTKHHQLSKFRSSDYDVICVYRSKNESKQGQIQFLRDLQKLLNNRRKEIITGDFNTDPDTSVIGREMRNWNYKQVISYPTHIDGNRIDHCYISDNIRNEAVKIRQTPVYYSDHDKIEISVN